MNDKWMLVIIIVALIAATIFAVRRRPRTEPPPSLPSLQWGQSADTGIYASLSAGNGSPRYVIAGKEVDRETFYQWLDVYVMRGMQP